MSVKIMGLVWELDLPQREKFVLLAYADHADHEGNNVFPSIGLIAWKTGYTTRSIQRITKKLIEDGILVEDGKSKYQTNKYKMDITRLRKLEPYMGGDKLSSPIYGGDILTGVDNQRGDKSDGGGDKMPSRGDTALSGDPSINPSLKPSFNGGGGAIGEAAKMCEELFGTLPSNAGDVIGEWVDSYPKEWIDDAIKESKKNQARSLNYVTKVLENWLKYGRKEKSNNGRSTKSKRLKSEAEMLAELEARRGKQ